MSQAYETAIMLKVKEFKQPLLVILTTVSYLKPSYIPVLLLYLLVLNLFSVQTQLTNSNERVGTQSVVKQLVLVV